MRRELEEIEKDIKGCMDEQEVLSDKRDALEKERLAVLRGTPFYCPDCGRKSTLSKWTFIEVSRYERPHGCTGGDRWHDNSPDKCGIRHKCGGIFYIPRLTHNEKLLKIMEKVGVSHFHKLFGNVENLAEKDLLMLCKR